MNGHLARLWLVPLLSVACDLPGAGACSHSYREPVLILTGATDGMTGRAIPSVMLDSLTVDERPIGVAVVSPAFGIVADSVSLVCRFACGFGTTPGRYAFRASAPGYRAERIALGARYAQFHGGCPSWNDGGTRGAITLTPA